MAVYKEEKSGTWRVIYRYIDWTGEKKQTQKRGFQTKREAQAWEREQLRKATSDLDMTFNSFVEQYTADMQTRIKENTWATKEHIIRSKLLPYFGKLKMCNITAQQIITWQNDLLNYKDEKGKGERPRHDVLWAMNTRFQGDRDIITIPGVRCYPLDPSAGPEYSPSIENRGISCKTIFDCTVPFHLKEKFKRAQFMEVDAEK